MPTVADYFAILILRDSEQRWPFRKILYVEIQIVIFGERIQIGEIGVKEVGGTKGAEGCHGEKRFNDIETDYNMGWEYACTE